MAHGSGLKRAGTFSILTPALLLAARPASADATLFAGSIAAGGARPIIGGSIGLFWRETNSLIGFELTAGSLRMSEAASKWRCRARSNCDWTTGSSC